MTRETFEANEKFIKDYNLKEKARATPLDNPLTGDVLKKMAEEKKEDKRHIPSGPK